MLHQSGLHMQSSKSHPLSLVCTFIGALLFCPIDTLSQAKSTLVSRDTLTTLSGSVYDLFTREPVPDATIQIADSRNLTSSDSTGAFAIHNLPPGCYTVRIRCLGYFRISIDSVRTPQVKPLHLGLRARLIHQDTEGVAEIAREDIAQGRVQIRIAGLIAIRDTLKEAAIRRIEARYGFQSVYSGCTDVIADLYNRTVYQYLDSLNGNGWRDKFEKEVQAVRTRKK